MSVKLADTTRSEECAATGDHSRAMFAFLDDDAARWYTRNMNPLRDWLQLLEPMIMASLTGATGSMLFDNIVAGTLVGCLFGLGCCLVIQARNG